MLENEANQARYLERRSGRARLYNAQWGDDFHNALHVLLTGETEGYYAAFADKPLDHLARALTEGFAYQGETFALHGKPRGEPSAHLPPDATIFFAQNHDQIGNRALGERLSKLVGFDKLKQTMVLLLLNPHIPLLFMGEEAAADTPFLFFCDWEGEAARLTREGRRREFSGFKAFSTAEMREAIPDPSHESTYQASKLDWNLIENAPWSRQFRGLTRELLAIRHQRIVPLLKKGFVEARSQNLGSRGSSGGINIEWRTSAGDMLQILTNFSGVDVAIPPLVEGEVLWPRGTRQANLPTKLRPADIIVRTAIVDDKGRPEETGRT
jgi:maltooligosyltrehalose trehalohydrolase